MNKIIYLALTFMFVFHVGAEAQNNIRLLYNWQDTTLPGSLIFGNTYNEVWGYEKDGREYGIIGTTAGTHIFDLTDTNNIAQIDFVAGAFQGMGVIHRDYHDFDDYLYAVCDEGQSSLQIIDLRPLPDSVSLLYDSDQLFSNVHNIFIDEETGLLYACSVSKNNPPAFKALEVFSLTDPLQPQSIFSIESSTISQVHDAYVKNGIAFLNGGNEGLFIYDFRDHLDPSWIGILDIYPQQGYNHSGWLLDDGKHYVFIDETTETQLKIVNIEDFDDIKVVSVFGTSNPLSSPHNIIIKNCIAYVSYYYDGLRIYNLSDPANPVETGYYDTYPQSFGPTAYEGAWGVYPFLKDDKILVSDMQTGLYLFKYKKTSKAPLADFSYTINETSVVFEDKSSNSPNIYEWNFSGTLSYSPDPVFGISQSGLYPVCLKVENDGGCDYKCDSIEVILIGTGNRISDEIMLKPFFSGQNLRIEIMMKEALTMQLQLYDKQGKHLFESTHFMYSGLNAIEIPLVGAGSSDYFLTLMIEEKFQTFRVLNIK